jgi:SAM-dependent methyltransferase
MSESDKRQHWEAIYSGRSPLEVSWYQKEPALSLRLIDSCRLAKDAAIIDVGGGASILVDRLLDQGYTRLAVLDISATALTFARNRLGPKASSIEWFEADITAFQPPHPFSLWHDRAVFHFLTDASERRRYTNVLQTSLMPGGHLILAAFAIGGPTTCSGLDIVQYNADKLLAELGDDFKLVDEDSETHATPTGAKQLFSYFHLQKIANP